MELKQAFEKVRKSKEYKDSIKENNGIFFSYALVTIEKNEASPWQLVL